MTTWLAGARTDARTRTMLDAAERIADLQTIVVQGSYSDGTASAGTHAGGGALDLRTWHLTTLQRGRLLLALRTVGFAAWYRTKAQGFDPHIHAIAIGCSDLSPSARAQVADYYDRKNGLANDGPDDGPWMRPIKTWEQYQADQNEDLPDTGTPDDDGDDDMATPEDVWGYENDGVVPNTDAFGVLVTTMAKADVAADKADYATKQLNSVAAGVSALSKALRDNGVITGAQHTAVNAELSGGGVPGLPR
ncbi:hypothetical protein [Jiangella muralis]|uniref:hypothetical protein n=1 Tax=Jiangella muralis TaxID=702383 RepID=UPI00069F749F|nr:hypothetical protein [Jiangella muralis]